MKKLRFKIPIFDFAVTWIEVEDKNDADKVSKECKKLNIPSNSIHPVMDYIRRDCMDGGETYRNMELKEFLVIIYLCKDEKKRREVVNHEKRHIEDRILEYLGINDMETAAYLAGYISRFIY
jgi:hypothetical protein